VADNRGFPYIPIEKYPDNSVPLKYTLNALSGAFPLLQAGNISLPAKFCGNTCFSPVTYASVMRITSRDR
jgi:hypothetical protein